MQLVSTGSNHTAHMKPLIKQCHRLPLRPFVRFFFSHKDLNLLRQQTTDRRTTSSGQYSDLLECLPG